MSSVPSSPEAVHCDVIGCRAMAAWQHDPKLGAPINEYLCDNHYGVLCDRKPLQGIEYVPLPNGEREPRPDRMPA